MEIFQFFSVAIAYFVYVAAKATQQLNVVYDCKRLIPAVSMVMAICDVVIMGNIAVEAVAFDVKGLVLIIFAMALGGTSGSLAAMAWHKKMRKNGALTSSGYPPHHP